MRIYLHIGTEKTGTTSIQNFMGVNHDLLLKRYHTLYPMSLGQPPHNIYNHIKLLVYAHNKPRLSEIHPLVGVRDQESLDRFRQVLPDLLAAEIAKHQPEKLVLSNEHVSSRLTDSSEISSLKQLLQLFSDDIRVILYLRRQDDYFVSSCTTSIKSGMNTQVPGIPGPIAAKHRYDYAALLDLWASVFGKENIIGRVFERPQLIEQDLLHDFLDIIGLPYNDSYEFLGVFNRSLSPDATLFLAEFNKHIPLFIDGEINPLRGDLVFLLDKISEELEQKHSLVDPDSLREFMARYEEGNRYVAQKYFAREDGMLFRQSSKYTAENASPHTLSVETAIDIAAQLWKIKENQLISLREKMSSNRASNALAKTPSEPQDITSKES